MKPHGMNANIMVFGREVAIQYGSIFEVMNMSKSEAISMESVCLDIFAKRITMVPQRKVRGAVDIYNTGHPRTAFYYETFGLVKYILMFKNGDITGKIRGNNEST